MSDRTKKILKLIAIVLAVALIGLIIYNLFFQKQPPAPTSPGKEEIIISEEFAPETKERLIALTDEAVLAAGLKKNSRLIYYAWNGTITAIDFNGKNSIKVGTVPAERAGEVKISPRGDFMGIKQFLPSGQFRWIIFDAEKQSPKTLPAGLTDIAFDPQEKRLAAALEKTSATDIALVDPYDLKQTRLASVQIPDTVLEWVSAETIALKTRPSGLAYGLLYALNAKTKKVSRLIGSTYGLTALFSPAATKVLYGQTESDGRGSRTKVLNLEKKTEINLGILTLPEKCAWSQDNRTLYCGVIKTGEDPVMPDDYYKGKIDSAGEDIVRINLDTGQTQKLIGANIAVEKPFLSPDEAYLFFINKKDGRLYRLTL